MPKTFLLPVHQVQISPPKRLSFAFFFNHYFLLERRLYLSWLDSKWNLSFFLSFCLLIEEIKMLVYYVLDVVVLEYHFLMMAVALCWCPGFYGIAHHNIDFYLFSLFGGKMEKHWVCLQETDVLLFLSYTPRKGGHLDPWFFLGLRQLFHGLIEKIMISVLGIWCDSVARVIILDIYAVIHENLVFLFFLRYYYKPEGPFFPINRRLNAIFEWKVLKKSVRNVLHRRKSKNKAQIGCF